MIRAEATRYTVCGLPPDHVDASVWCLTLEARGDDRWAVLRGARCLGTDGEWEVEPQPSSRTPEFLATHRFPLATALKLAVDAYPNLKINGYVVRDGKLVRATDLVDTKAAP